MERQQDPALKPPEYQSARGCLVMGIGALVVVAVAVAAAVLFGNFEKP